MSALPRFMGDMDFDRAIALVAAKQHGAFTRAQALRNGASQSTILRRVDLGVWERLYKGVYRLEGAPATPYQALSAARLTGGPGSVVSHRGAGRLLGLPIPGLDLEISVPHGRRVAAPSVIVHRTRQLEWVDRSSVQGIPVTAVARTLVDLASVLEPGELGAAVDHVLAHRLVPRDHIEARLSALRARPCGPGNLGAVLLDRPGGSRGMQSDFERDLFAALKTAGVPLPIPQYRILLDDGRWRFIDFAYPDVLLAIEADSFIWHASLDAWSGDRIRNGELITVGWRVLPVVYRDVVERPLWVAHQVDRARTAVEVRRLQAWEH
ncbi:MAG: hypothetical protein NVSMB32_03350 [Actinomycetota bacterium]